MQGRHPLFTMHAQDACLRSARCGERAAWPLPLQGAPLRSPRAGAGAASPGPRTPRKRWAALVVWQRRRREHWRPWPAGGGAGAEGRVGLARPSHRQRARRGRRRSWWRRRSWPPGCAATRMLSSCPTTSTACCRGARLRSLRGAAVCPGRAVRATLRYQLRWLPAAGYAARAACGNGARGCRAPPLWCVLFHDFVLQIAQERTHIM